MTHIALTGGEPLLDPKETREFFARARELWPSAHLRLYTTGDQLTRPMLEDLVAAGLNEIRFSVKPDDDLDAYERVLERLREASAYSRELRIRSRSSASMPGEPSEPIPARRAETLDVMVEMPVLPGDFESMRKLLDELEAMGAFGINLLEFCYPFNNWPEFSHRGFKLKNPPYEVAYNYEYAGGLAVDGSEETCLELVRYAQKRGFSLGVHYCSLENKHRSQMSQQNAVNICDDSCYWLDEGDFFLKTIKVFGADVAPVRAFLEHGREAVRHTGCDETWIYDAEDDCLRFHPCHLAPLHHANVRASDGNRISYAVSYNVLEQRGRNVVFRELKLELLQGEALFDLRK